MMKQIAFTTEELNNLQELISAFYSYYENDEVWNFADLDAQREIGLGIVVILAPKIGE
jgi:hypothetical protein